MTTYASLWQMENECALDMQRRKESNRTQNLSFSGRITRFCLGIELQISVAGRPADEWNACECASLRLPELGISRCINKAPQSLSEAIKS